MNLADVFTVLFIILGFAIVYVAYWLATSALFPQLTERCAERLGDSPVKATLVGLVTWIPLLLLGSFISSKAPVATVKFAGILIMLVTALVALAGSSGMALRIGTGLKASRDDSEPWRRVFRGGIVLALTFILPFVGTLVMAWTLVAGFGAMLLPRPRRAKTPELEPSVAAISAAQ